MHLDWQTLIAFAIVAAALWAVGRRLWGQLAAFRSRPSRRRVPPAPAEPAETPLIQVQLKPPAHLKRPPSNGP